VSPFTNNFLTPDEWATGVLIFRHKGLLYVSGAPCGKYMGGEPFKIIDPARHRRNMGNHGPHLQPRVRCGNRYYGVRRLLFLMPPA
jgi:hypothetical protein